MTVREGHTHPHTHTHTQHTPLVDCTRITSTEGWSHLPCLRPPSYLAVRECQEHKPRQLQEAALTTTDAWGPKRSRNNPPWKD